MALLVSNHFPGDILSSFRLTNLQQSLPVGRRCSGNACSCTRRPRQETRFPSSAQRAGRTLRDCVRAQPD